MTESFHCAVDTESRDEGLAGTASRADRFVLIEFPTPWPKKAVEAFGQSFADDLAAAAAEARAKILLIRRPGERTSPQRRWAVYDARARRCLWGDWESLDDLSSSTAAVSSSTGPAATHGWSAEPVVLVCTHARHDACCGVRGRPVAATLAEARPEQVWECTHVGGHRFAANLVLPLDGTYYGRMSADNVTDVIDAHVEKSEIAPEHLRGFSWMEPAAQVVAVEAHRRWGPAGADDILDASAVALGPDRWRVDLAGGEVLPTEITADVERVAGPEARLSCRADPTPTESFVIRTLNSSSQ